MTGLLRRVPLVHSVDPALVRRGPPAVGMPADAQNPRPLARHAGPVHAPSRRTPLLNGAPRVCGRSPVPTPDGHNAGARRRRPAAPLRSHRSAVRRGQATRGGESKDAHRSALRLPALCGTPTREEAKQVLKSSVAAQQEIIGRSTSLTQQRREVLPNPSRLEKLGLEQGGIHVERSPSAKNRSNHQEIVNYQMVRKKSVALGCIGKMHIVALKVPFHKANERGFRHPESTNRSTVKARFRRPSAAKTIALPCTWSRSIRRRYQH